MNNYSRDTLCELESCIDKLSQKIKDQILLAEAIIDLVIKRLSSLKDFVLRRGFSTQEEEIYFFKEIKPKFVSKLIYYNTIYKIEVKKPKGGKQALLEYINNEIFELKRFFDKNLDFYKYFRTGSTYLDHKYFIRGMHDIKLSLNSYYFEVDHNFSTSHDYKVAKIIANDMVQCYLEKQIYNIENNNGVKNLEINKANLKWTASKTDLIELIYALHVYEVFNNGDIDIKVIASHFEQMFNIELGDFYHTFLELRNRKKSSTKFLDLLREGLIKKIEEQDEK